MQFLLDLGFHLRMQNQVPLTASELNAISHEPEKYEVATEFQFRSDQYTQYIHNVI